jgi:serine/threonine protein kinase
MKGDAGRSTSPGARTDPRLGTTLAGYRILQELGRGGMGVVYLAEDAELGRQVALKILTPDPGEDDSFRRRFAREWRLAASLEHPNVIPIYGAGEADGLLWLAMRYVPGTDLRRLLQEEGALDPEVALGILSQVASALDAAHALGLVHRDVKPGNILLADTGSESFHAYLADFGLSKRISSATTLTESGAFVGTVAYASPEQVENAALDGRADQYALACVAYHCLVGQAPFADREDLAALWAHVFEPPPAISSRRPGLPPGLDSALARGMAKSPDDRYPSCAELVRSIRAQVAGASQAGVRPPPEKGRPRHDVFVSHHRADLEAARRVAASLREAGLDMFLSESGIDPERDWREQLEAALRDSAASAVLVGRGTLGSWDREDLRVARHLAAAGRLRLVPVLLPGLPEPLDPSVLPGFLASRAWVDLRAGLDQEASARSLARALRGSLRASRRMPADVSSPYRGLQAFQEEDAPFFFGREGDVQRLVELLKATRFLSVIGPSGSGKSSLVRAGLIPALRDGALPGSEAWQIRLVRPGAEPLVTLAGELLGLGSAPGMGATVDQLARDPRTLHLATSLVLGGRDPAQRVAWVVDQFEEAFTLCHDDAAREAFVANLLHAANAPGGRTVVVLTVRADFYPRLAAHPALAPAVAAHQFVVPPLDAEGLRLAVEGPADLAGARFEEGLVDTILGDTRTEPGALPLLEHALLELWERRAGSVLSLEGYRASGGVAGAIAARAEAVYAAFPPARQAVCRRVMLRLAQPGEGTEDTRRRARVGELATGPADAPDVDAVLDSLVSARLVTAGADERGEPGVEVAHEALIRAWPRLRGWLEEDRAGLRLHRRLTEAAEDWARLGRDQGDLWRGARLLEATEWQAHNKNALNPLEHEFLQASEAQADQEARETEERREKELDDARKIAAA